MKISLFFHQTLQKKTSCHESPADDRKRKFIKSDLALDTEGGCKTEGEVNFTASKHLAKFNWLAATCAAANYRISITAQRPVMVLTSLCQRSDSQIDSLLAAHSELQPVIMNSVVSDTLFCLSSAFSPLRAFPGPPSAAGGMAGRR